MLGRLIPAHAGSTILDWMRDHGEQAHPRSRGEHELPKLYDQGGWGSSPLTRGAQMMRTERIAVLRLIPAHAGSTDPRAVHCGYDAAHPRSRGEHTVSGLLLSIR